MSARHDHWGSWWAWRPVRTPDGWVWLHWVDRRAVDVPWSNFYSDGTTLTTRHYEHRRKR